MMQHQQKLALKTVIFYNYLITCLESELGVFLRIGFKRKNDKSNDTWWDGTLVNYAYLNTTDGYSRGMCGAIWLTLPIVVFAVSCELPLPFVCQRGELLCVDNELINQLL